MAFYDRGATQRGGGFETGIREALEAILASPHFIFRFEELPSARRSRASVTRSPTPISRRASRSSSGARRRTSRSSRSRASNVLSKPDGPRGADASACSPTRAPRRSSTRFAAQWLRLQDIDKVHPDALQFPNFRQQLADDMRRETELFFDSIVRENKSVLELFSADYTYLNESLAKHYGIPGVKGPEFRRVHVSRTIVAAACSARRAC